MRVLAKCKIVLSSLEELLLMQTNLKQGSRDMLEVMMYMRSHFFLSFLRYKTNAKKVITLREPCKVNLLD